MTAGRRVRRRERRIWTAGTVMVAALAVLAALALAAVGAGVLTGGGQAPQPPWQSVFAPAGDRSGEQSGAQSQQPEPQPKPDPQPRPEPDPQPQPEPEPGPKPDPVEEKVARLMAEMTLRDKICQMMFVTPTDITGVKKVTAAGEATRKALVEYPVGGLNYTKVNMVSQEQVSKMLHGVQEMSKIPLLLSCDEEGGRVTRLMSTVDTTWVDAMLDFKDDGPETAYRNAQTIAKDMERLGFNMDLAPVADVLTNPKNTVIGDRAYSDDYQQAASLLPSAVRGFRENGIACVIKHFPGHGGTTSDSHYGSAYVYRTLEELRAGELLPFQAGIDAGADAVMMGHLIVPDISEEPAVFSYEIVTRLLREEMGFEGVVMTDALGMKAIADHYGNRDVAVKAVQAGVDMLLSPMDLDTAIDALTDAVEDGTIPETRIDESVTRILRLKANRGLL